MYWVAISSSSPKEKEEKQTSQLTRFGRVTHDFKPIWSTFHMTMTGQQQLNRAN